MNVNSINVIFIIYLRFRPFFFLNFSKFLKQTFEVKMRLNSVEERKQDFSVISGTFCLSFLRSKLFET